MSWKITHVRPPVRTYSVPSSPASTRSVPGTRIGATPSVASSSARVWQRLPGGRSADRDAIEGTTSSPIARILSCTLIGPWSSPDASRAARTCTDCSLTSSVSLDGLDLGRRDLGSSTAAGPSVVARLRSS